MENLKAIIINHLAINSQRSKNLIRQVPYQTQQNAASSIISNFKSGQPEGGNGKRFPTKVTKIAIYYYLMLPET